MHGEQLISVPKKEVDLAPIRDELEKKFRETNGHIDLSKLNTNEPIIVDTEVSRKEAEYAASDIVTLRIRSETGKLTLIVKLTVSDKMSIVYKAVRPYIENREYANKFVVRTNFPNKAYDELDPRNLKELGLAPSCALVLQLK
jgi:hypothetical protein